MSTVFASITTPGPAGPAGRTALWLTGAGAPVTAQGLDGDMYLNSSTGDVYGPKATTWGGIVANIKGVPGGPGPAGPIGYSPLYIVAPGVPNNATGNNGDMYLNNTTSDLYGPKTAGAWGGIVANIRGTQGPPGVAYTPKGAWSAATTYTQGDMVTDGNIIYIALQSANLNHVPLTSPTWWQPATQGSSQWITSGSDIYYNTGKVGIGKIPAQYALEVVGTALTEISGGGKALCIPGAANLPSSFQLWKDPTPTGAANIGLGVPGGSASSDLVVSLFNAGWYERMRVTAGGNVGIGTTSPGSPLHVTNSGAASTSGQAVLILDAINDGGTIGSGPILAFATTGVPVCSIRSLTETAGAIGLAFATYSGGMTEKMRISATGKVGIGNTGPGYALDVTGDVNCTGSFRVNGTPISAGGGVTTQSNVTGSRVGGNTYRNTTGKAMMVNAGVALTAGTIVAYSDAAASPTTVVANAGLNSGGTQTVGVSFWVLNNNYYKVVGGTPAYWIEWT